MNSPQTQASLLFLANYGYVKRLAVRQAPHPEMSDDLVQQVFVEFTEKADQWTIGDDVRPLLAGILKKIVLGYWRDKARHNQPETLYRIADHLRKLGETDPSPPQHDEELGALRRCLDGLPTKHRRLLDLYYFENLKTPEIAAQLKKEIDTVCRTLSRLRERLRKCIRRRLTMGGADA